MYFSQWSKVFFILFMVSGGSEVFAQGRSVVGGGDVVSGHTLKDQKWGFSPQMGVLVYEDSGGGSNARATVGAGFDWNLTEALIGEDPLGSYIGVSVSGLYSHVGPGDGNFFGTSSSGGGGSNLVQIPIDLKLGGHYTDDVRLTVRGGGNLTYRSAANAINLGAGSESSGSLWKIYPNVGLEGEFKVSRNVSLLARPDLTITPGKNLFVAVVGATFLGF